MSMLLHVAHNLFDKRPDFLQFSVLFVLECYAVVHFNWFALSLCDLVLCLLSCQTKIVHENLFLKQFPFDYLHLIPIQKQVWA